ncbi:flocculation protein FLO11-like [Sceloporus undulatus]|uniref:flocculation protein FLO11-like n=1 Tax=Sceloporus undulatus TaxID=8520 RepID=UPI001C4C344D|nr:flocculation protein FLO11-like [Sceloporus undulatus]
MELLLGLCAFFQLFLSSSCFCGLRHQRPNLDQAYTTPSGQSEEALEAPWLVNIYGNGKRCQGVVLSSWWILTAANCFLVMMPSHVELTGSSGRISTETVSQFVPHKGFSSWDKTPNNDLGLILLGQPLNLGRKDMWPACVPDTETSVNTQENCMIFERGAQGTTQETRVDDLVTSECAVHWPDTTEKWNLCVARRMSSGTDCTVPIGSPVICYNPRNENWEVMAIVTRSLHNCTAPILASQLLSHLQWLKKQGALETSFDQELEHTATPEAEPTLATNIATSQEEPTLATNIDTSQAKPTRQAYLVRHITARPTTLVHSSKEPKPSTTAHNIILLASPTLHALSHVSPTIKQFVPQTTNPTTTTSPTTTSPTTTTTSTVPSTTKQTSTVSTTQQSSSVISSTTVITSTTTQQTSTKQPSSTTTETTVTTTSRPSTSPTFRPPHVIIIPATTPRKASPVPATDVNQGAPVRFVVAGPQFPKNKGEESPSPGPSLALAAPPRLQIPIIPNLGLPVQVKLRQCEMGLAWNSNSHAYQLSKMAVLIDRKVGCGLRPGFVPKCPSCSQAEMGEFPWIVSLRLSIQHFCAGSILNPWWILTTANCVNLIKNSETWARCRREW